jgi:hypothetical protein
MAHVLRWPMLMVVWALSLVVVGALVASAQGRQGRPASPDVFTLESPTILTGADVGFRLERVRDGVPIGRVVVRVDGRWVEPQGR